jgi:hypothetical protein
MAQPIWVTPAGSLGTIPEGVFYQIPLKAYEPNDEPVYYQLIAGKLPDGVQVAQNGLIMGVPKAIASVQGVPLPVARDVTSKFAVRAYTKVTIGGVTVINRLADRTFTITVSGQNAPEFITPAGTIGTFYDGSLVPGIQIQYTDQDPGDIIVVKLVAGQLPTGLNLSPLGLISGYIAPNTTVGALAGYSRDRQGYDQYPYDFITKSSDVTYEFTLEVTDGKSSNLRTFNMVVYSRNDLTADNTTITADNTFVTADGTPIRLPIILTPQGSIGSTRNDNFFAFQFQGIDLDGSQFEFELIGSIPGLTLDPVTGWLYGYIPNLGLTENVYNFSLKVYIKDNPTYISGAYYYSLTVTGPINSDIIWLTPSDLGSINNGSTSTLYVEAVNIAGLSLQYRLLSGSNSLLPQGLQLLSSGHIAGRCSFDTFALDLGTTTFDVSQQNGADPTTFDLDHTFVVEVYSLNAVVSFTKTFTIHVVRKFNEPYDNLYVEAMPPQDDRAAINGLLQNTDVFPVDLIYRNDDPNFGVATRVVYNHAFGLTPSTLADYYSSLYKNHYWKTLTLGNIKVAQAVNNTGTVIYEVVYSQVIDNLLNDQGQSVSKEVTLPYPVTDYADQEITTVFPNSLINMRDQVIDTVGQVSNILPPWMTSKQSNGRVLGFTPAWVIAYAKPGKGEQIAYNIRNQIGNALNLIDFEVDRYELDRLLTKNWDPITGQWRPNPPSYTTFDATTNIPASWLNDVGNILPWLNNASAITGWYNTVTNTTPPTTFDHNSLQFIAPVDMYSNTTDYDKYLVFPKHTILG